MGAVQEGTATAFSTIVPHCAAQEVRHSSHPGMAAVSTTGTEVMMVVERRGIHRAPKLDATRDHAHGTCRCHGFPAPGGPHLTPLDGCGRVMQDALGAGRGLPELPQLSQRTRPVLMAHQARPIDAFHWERIPPRTSRDLLDIREEVLLRDGPICATCGGTFHESEVHVDHIVLRAKFKDPLGADHLENHQILCNTCHRVKTESDLKTLSRMRR